MNIISPLIPMVKEFLKIGQHLPKLWTRSKCPVFLTHGVVPVVTTTSDILSSDKIQNRDILVPAYSGCAGKWTFNECRQMSSSFVFWLKIHNVTGQRENTAQRKTTTACASSTDERLTIWYWFFRGRQVICVVVISNCIANSASVGANLTSRTKTSAYHSLSEII